MTASDNGCGIEAGWVEVRTADGRLLFELDPGRWLIRVKRRGEGMELVDLLAYVAGAGGKGQEASRHVSKGLRGV